MGVFESIGYVCVVLIGVCVCIGVPLIAISALSVLHELRQYRDIFEDIKKSGFGK